MIEVISNIVEFAFYSLAAFIIIYLAVGNAVKNSLLSLIAIFLPLYLQSLQKVVVETQDHALNNVLDAEQDGEITSEEAVKILRNMRGEVNDEVSK